MALARSKHWLRTVAGKARKISICASDSAGVPASGTRSASGSPKYPPRAAAAATSRAIRSTDQRSANVKGSCMATIPQELAHTLPLTTSPSKRRRVRLLRVVRVRRRSCAADSPVLSQRVAHLRQESGRQGANSAKLAHGAERLEDLTTRGAGRQVSSAPGFARGFRLAHSVLRPAGPR